MVPVDRRVTAKLWVVGPDMRSLRNVRTWEVVLKGVRLLGYVLVFGG